MAKGPKKRKEKSEKSHEKMDSLMKTWQTGVLARKFESREKLCPQVKTWQIGAMCNWLLLLHLSGFQLALSPFVIP